MNSSAGATAVVTGSGRGIGAATAIRLAELGHPVGVVDRDIDAAEQVAAQIRAADGTAMAVRVDVSDETAVADGVAAIADELGPPTVLVNNAGFAHAVGVVDMTSEQWTSVLGTMLNGAFFFARATVPHMDRVGWGRIVSISSTAALGDPGRVGYSTAKAGLLGFTRTLSSELGPRGITVNAVAPGFVSTDMTALTAKRVGRDFDEHQRLAAAATAVGRVGRPEDIAHAVAFFVGAESSYITGQVLFADGGVAG